MARILLSHKGGRRRFRLRIPLSETSCVGAIQRLAACIYSESQSFTVQQSACGIPMSAQAYSLNMTVVPPSTLGYLTLWPTGHVQPLVSTLNRCRGRLWRTRLLCPQAPVARSALMSATLVTLSSISMDISRRQAVLVVCNSSQPFRAALRIPGIRQALSGAQSWRRSQCETSPYPRALATCRSRHPRIH